MTSDAERAHRLIGALQLAAYEAMWVGQPNVWVRRTRALARSLVGDLDVARAAGVGLVPEQDDPQAMLGFVNREFAAAGFSDRVHEADLRALGLAHSRGGWVVHSLGGRLLFPLHGPEHGLGVAAMALDGRKPRWRCHTAALGTAVPSTLVFEAGLADVDQPVPIVVCSDPAAALRYRSGGSTLPKGWGPVGPAVAPPTRRLTETQASWIARHARGRVGLLIDEDDPKRVAQFTGVLEAAGLEVSNVVDEMQQVADSLEHAVHDRKSGSRHDVRRRAAGRAMSSEGAGPR